jgi:hypothetical protein
MALPILFSREEIEGAHLEAQRKQGERGSHYQEGLFVKTKLLLA